jgi:diguanylate cyclase (GGDEF)-like protein
MIVHDRAVGDSSRRTLSARRWALWSIPAPARSFLLLIEATAAALTIMLLLTQSVSRIELLRVGVLAVLAIGYAEGAARIERNKRYLLGGGKVSSNPISVWVFAGVLSVPPGWAAVLVAIIYAHAVVQQHHENTGRPHRVVFTGATVMLSMLAASAVLAVAGGGDVLHGGLLGPATVLAALLACTLVNFVLLLTGMWLTARPPSVRAMLPAPGALGYELATLALGIVTAEFLRHTLALTPIVLGLAVCLHRSSLVSVLHHAARTDAKTGLLTASAWTAHAEGILSRSNRDGQPVTVLFCDLDNFKTVNDTHGHLVGDHVLVAVADCLRRELRDYDDLGRYGGEEFVVILDRLGLPEAQLVAERLRDAISALHVDHDVQITVSIGLAHHQPGHGPAGLQQLLARADAAVYQAKASGRDRVQTANRPQG